MSAPEQGPITEFAFLNLIPPTTLQTPEFSTALLSAIRAQSAQSGYPLHIFYSHGSRAQLRGEGAGETPKDAASPRATTLYLIAGWQSVQAHYDWIASSKNQEIMKSFNDARMLEFGGLAHLDIDFTKVAFDECDAIAWRKKAAQGAPISADERDGKGDEGRYYGGVPTSSELPTIITMVPHGVEKDLTRAARYETARTLWTFVGTTVDGPREKYELTAYSEGRLRADFNDDYEVIRKWAPGYERSN